MIQRLLFLSGLLSALLLVACNPAGTPTPDTSHLTPDTPHLTPHTAQNTDPTRPVVADPTTTPHTPSSNDDYQIITVLAPDAIPSIDNPQFVSVDEAQELYGADEQVIGVVFNGEARAYSVPLLSRHEIVNDTVGGVKIAVTW